MPHGPLVFLQVFGLVCLMLSLAAWLAQANEQATLVERALREPRVTAVIEKKIRNLRGAMWFLSGLGLLSLVVSFL